MSIFVFEIVIIICDISHLIVKNHERFKDKY